jgi:hypothetical protein
MGPAPDPRHPGTDPGSGSWKMKRILTDPVPDPQHWLKELIFESKLAGYQTNFLEPAALRQNHSERIKRVTNKMSSSYNFFVEKKQSLGMHLVTFHK